MLRYAFSRLTSLAISLIVASVVIFLVVEVAPGDPACYMLGTGARPDTVAALRDQLGLDPAGCVTCTGLEACCMAISACPTLTAPPSRR